MVEIAPKCVARHSPQSPTLSSQSSAPILRMPEPQPMDEKAERNSRNKKMSPCDGETLKKCLDENKGDYVKCQSQIEAFKSSCSLKNPRPSHESISQAHSSKLM
ncbi:hypothetical protein CJ030_MR1G000267 [Morella rubra]|uniref:Uncharacterized protein n=1 Tax=Morella rubra TaxID=262757 RepID=A0A6A1WRS6_9ROSI|nr:hypothetical protein CJ030_MR1G000267 [Morella rubra]